MILSSSTIFDLISLQFFFTQTPFEVGPFHYTQEGIGPIHVLLWTAERHHMQTSYVEDGRSKKIESFVSSTVNKGSKLQYYNNYSKCLSKMIGKKRFLEDLICMLFF